MTHEDIEKAVGLLVARTDALHDAIAEITHALQSPMGLAAAEVIVARLEESCEARANALAAMTSR